MTLVPPGAQLAAADLPPPPPQLDPREPTPGGSVSRRGQRTPVKARSPAGSRAASPSRPGMARSISSDGTGNLHSPIPKTLSPGGSSSPVPIQPIPHPSLHGHHLSRPSSPSSIHSSTSAIFERDIEFPAVGALSLNPTMSSSQSLNHKPSRLTHPAHGSALDHSVPAVLDDAVEALQGAYTSRGMHGLEIEAPAGTGIPMARQASANLSGLPGRKHSTGPLGTPRSASPISVASGKSGVASPQQSPPIMGQLQTQQQQQQNIVAAASSILAGTDSVSPISPSSPSVGGELARPGMAPRMSTGPQVPGGWQSGWKKEEEANGALTPPAAGGLATSPKSDGTATPPAAIPSHLSPTKDKRRISFISYNDLLLSVPTTVTNLGEITSGALSPDHLPGTVSPNIPTRSPVIATGFSPTGNPTAGSPVADGSVPVNSQPGHKASWDAAMGGRPGGLGFGDGEWGREGLGKGLEQRLEDLVQTGHQ